MDSSDRDLHIICERDVGLFSLIQQVVANISWALAAGRTPIVYFSRRCVYFAPGGYNGGDSVWEYYFEPLLADFPVVSIPLPVRQAIDRDFMFGAKIFRSFDNNIIASSQFGHHRRLKGKTLSIPWGWRDPDLPLRKITAELIHQYVRPHRSICDKVEAFYLHHMKGRNVFGIHARGTDVVSDVETHGRRRGSLVLDNYLLEIRKLVARVPDAALFVATDDQNTVDRLFENFGERIITYDSIRHIGGDPAGLGPTGHQMPAYIADNPEKAAQNGEEAVIEYLLLCRCQHLVHNGGGLARTVLLAKPELTHTNVHLMHTSLASRCGIELNQFGKRMWRKLRRLPDKPRRIAAKRAEKRARQSGR